MFLNTIKKITNNSKQEKQKISDEKKGYFLFKKQKL